MPLRNAGSLLQQVVVTELVRAVGKIAGERAALQFLNPFAMPPLSEWMDTNQPLNALSHDRLLEVVSWPHDGDSFSALYASCLSRDATLGPSCALLAAMLGRRQSRKLRMWLNDTGERYGIEATRGIATLPALLRQLDPQSDAPAIDAVQSETPYPTSLAELTAQLAASAEPLAYRVGFLDPDRYTITSTPGPHTSSRDYRAWL